MKYFEYEIRIDSDVTEEGIIRAEDENDARNIIINYMIKDHDIIENDAKENILRLTDVTDVFELFNNKTDNIYTTHYNYY